MMGASEALLLVMIGFVTLLFIERVILSHHHKRHGDGDEVCEHAHELTSTAAFIGLAVHGSMAGFALGVAAMVQDDAGILVFLAIIAHKGIEVMALATTFRLADISVRRSMLLVGLFTLIVPVAAFVAVPFIDLLEHFEVGAPIALAAGTFLYVGVYDLLPEAFHLEKSGYRAFLSVVIGIVVMYLFSILTGHIH